MSLTPRKIVLAARSGLGIVTIGGITLGAADFGAPAPLLLAGGGWAVSALTLLSFPRVRKNDLLMSLAGCSALAGYLTAARGFEAGMLAALACLAGPASIAIMITVMRVRHLAAANSHMPFSEWQQLDRRRRRNDTPVLASSPKTVVIEAERNC